MIYAKPHSNPDNWMEPRPIVVVEDHFHHISKLTETISRLAPELFDSLTIVCLDRPGPDTTESIRELTDRHRTLQFAVAIQDNTLSESVANRVYELPDSVFANQLDYCRTVASLLRPEGLLIQDIELESLTFVPKDRWWESTFLATAIRGIFGSDPISCSFFSNKRGYEATFGAELLAAGHDPRDVLNKNDLEEVVVPTISRFLRERFCWTLTYGQSLEDQPVSVLLTQSEREYRWLQEELDLIIWPEFNQSVRVGGRLFQKAEGHSLSAGGNEAITWMELAKAFLAQQGVSTHKLGERIAAPGAAKAETTNSAARHIHALRKRLQNSNAILTIDGEYRLGDSYRVGIVERSRT